jgi:flagellar motility protein MotE (MotC chaperone)
MNTFLREFRLIPMVLFATATLLVLKLGGLILAGGYTLASPRKAQADEHIRTVAARRDSGRSWAQDVLGYPDITGSVDKPPEKDAGGGKGDAIKAEKPVDLSKSEGTPVPLDGPRMPPAERAVLERLQQRRQELEQRARELDIREGLIGAAEKRLEARVIELKDTEARINATLAKKDDADAARLKSLVTMYENMKAKEAARIFDRLDLRILIDVASQINPRRMSDIMAQMTPEAAERLTVELATRSNQVEKPAGLSDLPKIEGKPGR